MLVDKEKPAFGGSLSPLVPFLYGFVGFPNVLHKHEVERPVKAVNSTWSFFYNIKTLTELFNNNVPLKNSKLFCKYHPLCAKGQFILINNFFNFVLHFAKKYKKIKVPPPNQAVRLLGGES